MISNIKIQEIIFRKAEIINSAIMIGLLDVYSLEWPLILFTDSNVKMG